MNTADLRPANMKRSGLRTGGSVYRYIQTAYNVSTSAAATRSSMEPVKRKLMFWMKPMSEI